MKIIISHDVDNLYGRDHWFRDLTYPKLWVRETLNFISRRITFTEWYCRFFSCFRHKRNHIPELIEFDRTHGIPSTFFFGMANGLGMSYKPSEAKRMIQYVKDQGMGIGVHGICYDEKNGIATEKNTFSDLMGIEPEGIRMHYVRYDKKTFSRLDQVGYRYDSTEFNKKTGTCVKEPYKIGKMWEFPVCIMDSYLPYNFMEAKKMTIDAINIAKGKKIEFFTILLHDPHFSKAYQEYKKWYKWLVKYAKENNFKFVSFKEAIVELERE